MAKKTKTPQKVVARFGEGARRGEVFQYTRGKLKGRFCTRGGLNTSGPFKGHPKMGGCFTERAPAEAKARKLAGARK